MDRAAALHFDPAALNECVFKGFDRQAVVADLRGRRMTSATVTYHLHVSNAGPCRHYEQADVEDATRGMAALRGPGGEGDTNLGPGENPNPYQPLPGCVAPPPLLL